MAAQQSYNSMRDIQSADRARSGSSPLDLTGGTADFDEIINLAGSVIRITQDRMNMIRTITARTKILALNALIEATKAGEAGRGFSVVANEVKEISVDVTNVTQNLTHELHTQNEALNRLGLGMIQTFRAQRLVDLALNGIEIIDRNLYERTCDVRWWATDSAMVDCVADPTPEARAHASRRLGVILDSYTVYLDLWVADRNGRVIANGRPERYPHALSTTVMNETWFQQAMQTRDGSEFAVAEIYANKQLVNSAVATYATAIRANGDNNGPILGVLGIHFDWGPQANTVVKGIRLTPEEQRRTRVLLLDYNHRIIAASDGVGVLNEVFPLKTNGQPSGAYVDEQGNVVGFHLTPGYESYRGLGWYGCIIQKPKAD